MQTVVTLAELYEARRKLPGAVGLVPTMGYLHQGHISLAQQAVEENDSVIATLFVNPTQFGPNEDLEAYPRDLQGDLEKLAGAGVDLVWMPTPEIMYPPGYQTGIVVREVAKTLEGAMRPGHFEGVATVVAKLFNATQPDRAYFGQKDAQQTVVIRRMAADLNFQVRIVICPTVREPDGLALSSRNSYLSPAQRAAAPVLHRALSAARSAFEDGARDGAVLRRAMEGVLAGEPLAEPQYVSCAHPETLLELDRVDRDALFSMAVYIGRTRLIDNFLLQGGRWV